MNWQKKWVLLVDVMGVSDAVRDTTQRDRIAAAYVASVAGATDGGGLHLDLIKAVESGAFYHRTSVPNAPDVQPEAAALRERRLHESWKKCVRVFSDSIFFFFDGQTPVSPQAPSLTSPYFLPRVAARLSRLLWMNGLPHRGAIAYGDCYLREEPEIFLGDAIDSAYRWEKHQEWLGISIEPKSVDAAAEAFKSQPGLWRTAVPTKSGDKETILINLNERVFGDMEIRGVSPERDAIVSGFDEAWQGAKRTSRAKVVEKYRCTARIWRHLGLTTALDENDPIFARLVSQQ